MRTVPLVLSLLAASASAGIVARQLSVPDVEAAQKKAFEGFDRLAAMGAYVEGSGGEFLGKVSKGYGSDCLGNAYGAGNAFKGDGLFNKFSPFGSEASTRSAFCDTAFNPPTILVKTGSNVYSVGPLTTNSSLPTTGQKISPYLLQAWLKSR